MASRTQARGYGQEHQRLRARWAKRIKAGEHIPCSRCGEPVLQGQAWHLDHSDDRTAYLGPAHAWCNQSAGGHKAVKLRKAKRMPQSRAW